MLRVTARIPDADGAVVVQALTRMAEEMRPVPGGMWDPFESRCADALVSLASQRVADNADPDRACIVVHVLAEALLR